IARTNRVSLPTHRQCTAAVVTCRHAVGVWDGYQAGATHRQTAWTRNTWRIGVIDRDGLRAGCAVAALIRCSVSPADDKLSGAIARTNRVSLPTQRQCTAAVVTRRHAVGVRDGHLAG